MFKHNIDEMADTLIQAGLLQPEQKEKAVESLRSYWMDRIADVWTLEDVMEQAEEMELPRALKESEGRQILRRLPLDMDASVGINTGVIQAAIQRHMQRHTTVLG